jgi:hypothetical protein
MPRFLDRNGEVAHEDRRTRRPGPFFGMSDHVSNRIWESNHAVTVVSNHVLVLVDEPSTRCADSI